MTKIEELLRDDERAILAEAASSIARLEHYGRDGEDATRRRVEALYRQVVRAVRARDLDDLLEHASRIARERFQAAFELSEVAAAFERLESAISRRASARLPVAELVWGLGLVSTAFAHARGELGRTWPDHVDLSVVFRRTDPAGRSAHELVHPV